MTADMHESEKVTAVLGPTNTGKTHYAMTRMLGHASGMIGFPLRLLARENYDRAVAIKGKDQVALITGEEKILPKDARWILCTVESMPLDRDVAFVAIDEIQMCADPDRGHIFTERLLHARGRSETMFLGAETVRPLIGALVPEAEIVTRPRFSVLTHVGPRKISRLPARSALVAYTTNDVYAIAELIRRQRGGAAVVLGALSPRTRNAQVAMYQAGEVDYLVATDAIGMGLNMDVDHVAFAALKKFDGRRVRPLTAAELSQAAGRAGRHMNDGTFGTTSEVGPLDEDIAERIEEHRFDPLTSLQWRNSDLDTSTIDALRNSLRMRPNHPSLKRARTADDEVILDRLRKEAPVIDAATTPERVQLLWDICQIPDFRGVMSDAHANLLLSIFNHLVSDVGRLPKDWIANHVTRLDRTDGDIDTLVGRIAGIRTWTYVSFREDWVAEAAHWQERTRAIEDKLSDALHDRLTQRFVDRKTSVLVAKLKDSRDLVAAVRPDGSVLIEGEHVGTLAGLRFKFEGVIEGDAGRIVANAALRALRTQVAQTARQISQAPDGEFQLETGASDRLPRIIWRDHPIGRLIKGRSMLSPEVSAIADDLLEANDRLMIEDRLQAWLKSRLAKAFEGLHALEAADLTGAARGIAFQIREGMGSLRRENAAEQITALTKEDRKTLRALGVRIGRDMAFIPALLKPEAIAWRAIVWALDKGYSALPPVPDPGRVSVKIEKRTDTAFLESCGFRPLGPLAVRIDMAERLTTKAWQLAKSGPFQPSADLTSMIGASNEELPGVLKALGFKRIQRKNPEGEQEERYIPRRHRSSEKPKPAKKDRRRAKPDRVSVDPDSPFAKLKELSFGD